MLPKALFYDEQLILPLIEQTQIRFRDFLVNFLGLENMDLAYVSLSKAKEFHQKITKNQRPLKYNKTQKKYWNAIKREKSKEETPPSGRRRTHLNRGEAVPVKAGYSLL